ncbi:MAG: hypothetical protein JXR42_00600 [Gammaproteobacteria bacterium]|nr:hypothetical protein [Gammaproteobacteria bacterium]
MAILMDELRREYEFFDTQAYLNIADMIEKIHGASNKKLSREERTRLFYDFKIIFAQLLRDLDIARPNFATSTEITIDDETKFLAERIKDYFKDQPKELKRAIAALRRVLKESQKERFSSASIKSKTETIRELTTLFSRSKSIGSLEAFSPDDEEALPKSRMTMLSRSNSRLSLPLQEELISSPKKIRKLESELSQVVTLSEEEIPLAIDKKKNLRTLIGGHEENPLHFLINALTDSEQTELSDDISKIITQSLPLQISKMKQENHQDKLSKKVKYKISRSIMAVNKLGDTMNLCAKDIKGEFKEIRNNVKLISEAIFAVDNELRDEGRICHTYEQLRIFAVLLQICCTTNELKLAKKNFQKIERIMNSEIFAELLANDDEGPYLCGFITQLSSALNLIESDSYQLSDEKTEKINAAVSLYHHIVPDKERREREKEVSEKFATTFLQVSTIDKIIDEEISSIREVARLTSRAERPSFRRAVDVLEREVKDYVFNPRFNSDFQDKVYNAVNKEQFNTLTCSIINFFMSICIITLAVRYITMDEHESFWFHSDWFESNSGSPRVEKLQNTTHALSSICKQSFFSKPLDDGSSSISMEEQYSRDSMEESITRPTAAIMAPA